MSISGFLTFASEAIIMSILQINALNKDGDNPANHTKIISAVILIINESFFLPIRFPKNIAIPENIDKCIPESARMCDKPAFLKLPAISEEVYSFAPHNKASKSPPAAPHENINLLN